MFPREVNDNRIDEEKIKNYTENELYYYFTDEKSIYAFFSDDIKVYPNRDYKTGSRLLSTAEKKRSSSRKNQNLVPRNKRFKLS